MSTGAGARASLELIRELLERSRTRAHRLGELATEIAAFRDPSISGARAPGTLAAALVEVEHHVGSRQRDLMRLSRECARQESGPMADKVAAGLRTHA